ncbi:hypothetical protein [Rhodohalobacter sp.]|uniref:hypothetical protein n=1 Tax=Rhodohalobacter sp. TaxID=1974210 RepID=UPI003569C025
MRNRLRIVTIVLIAAALFYSCDTSLDGDLNENQPPKTSLTVDNIQVDEESRLSSRIDISWWGDDPDGYIVGYEYAISDTSEGNWTFTTQTDSTFILPISPGEETDDVLFAVRAIDNEDLKDPVGASVEFPLRNTDPVTEFNSLELPPDTTYSLFSFGWSIDDPDGLQTLQRTEIAINDTTNGWTEIPIEADDQDEFFVSFDITDASQSEATAQVFLGRSFRETDITVDGFIPDGENTFYVRTVDLAQAQSETLEFDWYIKRQSSNILILNDDASSTSIENLNYHMSQLESLGFNFDVVDISDGVGLEGGIVPLSESFSSVINPTLNRALAKWDHIYHFSNNLNRNINYGQEIFEVFFEDGGTLFTNALISRDANRTDDPLYNFLAISDFVPVNPEEAEDGFIIENGAEVTSMHDAPDLIYNGGFSSRIWPFNSVPGSIELYEADLSKRLVFGQKEYSGPSTIAVLNPERNVLFFGIDLTDLQVKDNSGQDISPLLEELLINRLGFSQQ